MPESDLPSNIGGQWSDVFDWPIIGIESILTPDGKILTYGTDQLGQQGGALIYDVWDPATNTHYTLPNKTPTDMFCSAAIVVPSTGDILITGGDARPMGHTNMGVADVNVFDYRDMSVSPSEDGPMSYQRWYPTVVELANGKGADSRRMRHERRRRRDARTLHARGWLEKSDGSLQRRDRRGLVVSARLVGSQTAKSSCSMPITTGICRCHGHGPVRQRHADQGRRSSVHDEMADFQRSNLPRIRFSFSTTRAAPGSWI